MQGDLRQQLRKAVRTFWSTRVKQFEHQGAITGQRDHGNRGAVTGGKHCDGFIQLVSRILLDTGLPHEAIFARCDSMSLPGYFRPTKEWDLIVVMDGLLLVTVEFKSHIGPSFGNNYNNRTEEALGSATDFRHAYREGAFKPSPSPWLGYFMFLEEAEGSTRPVKVQEKHFPVFPEFHQASYAKRYELLCQRLVRERLYDGACLLMSSRRGGIKGEYREPLEELRFLNFATSLTAHVSAYLKLRGQLR
jgi:hypothetical protein